MRMLSVRKVRKVQKARQVGFCTFRTPATPTIPKLQPEGRRSTSMKTSWLDALKGTLEEEPCRPSEDSREPSPPTIRKVQKPREEAGGKVADIRTARPCFAARDEGERRLIAAGWEPKERMGLIIWASPRTGFYCSQEVALHRLDERSEG